MGRASSTLRGLAVYLMGQDKAGSVEGEGEGSDSDSDDLAAETIGNWPGMVSMMLHCHMVSVSPQHAVC